MGPQRRVPVADASMGLRDWVSEKEDVRLLRLQPPQLASMGLRDWVSEKVPDCASYPASRLASMGLRDWVSEKVHHHGGGAGDRKGASMGLRDWVSEKASMWSR